LEKNAKKNLYSGQEVEVIIPSIRAVLVNFITVRLFELLIAMTESSSQWEISLALVSPGIVDFQKTRTLQSLARLFHFLRLQALTEDRKSLDSIRPPLDTPARHLLCSSKRHQPSRVVPNVLDDPTGSSTTNSFEREHPDLNRGSPYPQSFSLSIR
jgi:hypothetical protein